MCSPGRQTSSSTSGSGARAGTGLPEPSIPAAWGNHQKEPEVLTVSVPGQHLPLPPVSSGIRWGLHGHEGWQNPPHCHPPSPSVSAQAKTEQQHPGIRPTRNTAVFVIPVLDLALKSVQVHPGDTAALAAPDSVTLKRCCQEPPRRLHGGCANPAAPGGLCWGSQRLRGPSPGSCQVGQAPGGNSSAPSLGKGFPQPAGGFCRVMPAGPLAALPQGCTHTCWGRARASPPLAAASPCARRAGGKQSNLLPAQTRRLAGKVGAQRDCRVVTRRFLHPTRVHCTQPGCRQGSSTHCPAQPQGMGQPSGPGRG